jgi:hypothetical protein
VQAAHAFNAAAAASHLASQGQLNARAIQAISSHPQAFAAMSAQPKAFSAVANNASALQAIVRNADAFNALKGVHQFQALAANPSFAMAMRNSNFAASLYK